MAKPTLPRGMRPNPTASLPSSRFARPCAESSEALPRPTSRETCGVRCNDQERPKGKECVGRQGQACLDLPVPHGCWKCRPYTEQSRMRLFLGDWLPPCGEVELQRKGLNLQRAKSAANQSTPSPRDGSYHCSHCRPIPGLRQAGVGDGSGVVVAAIAEMRLWIERLQDRHE
jgi:hypothetical protein